MQPPIHTRPSSEEPYLSISQPYHSYSPPDLFGFPCTSTCSHSALSTAQDDSHPIPYAAADGYSPYPSPPTSDCSLKSNVPLPGWPPGDSNHQLQYGGVLDSPLVSMSSSAFDLPLSPPQTLQTNTLALPPLESTSLTPESSPSTGSQSLSRLLDAQVDSRSPFSPLVGVNPACRDDQLLSPLSPEFGDRRITSPTQREVSVLLGDGTPDESCLLPTHYGDHSFHFMDQDMDWYLQSPTMSTHDLPMDENDSMSHSDVSPDSSPAFQILTKDNPPLTRSCPFIDPFFDRPEHNGLLLIDDVPPPRSPSPENFDLNESVINGCADPDLQRLVDLRRRSQAEERTARQLEHEMLERGDICGRSEAKVERKRQKERAREISALLRLKLGDEVIASPKSENEALEWKKKKGTKKVIKSIPQLVARMVFRRREAKTAVPLHPVGGRSQARSRRSSLSSVAFGVGMEEDKEEEDIDMDLDVEGGAGLGLGLGSFDSDPWTTERSGWD